MRWRRKKKTTVATVTDPELEAARKATAERLRAARNHRDQQLAKLHEERQSVTEPLKELVNRNHLSELALEALRRTR